MSEVIEITVPTTATTDSPTSATVTVGRGILTNVFLRFSESTNGTNKVQIMKDDVLLFPRTASSFFRLYRPPVQFPDRESLTATSSVIKLRGWSDDARYPHKIILQFDVLPFDDAECVVDEPFLEMYTNSGPATGTFAPYILTSVATDIVCDYGDGNSDQIFGTIHAFSHTYSALENWRVRFSGAAPNLVTRINCYSDRLTLISSLKRFSSLLRLDIYSNTSLVTDIGEFGPSITQLYAQNNVGLYGDVALLSRSLVTYNGYHNDGVYGNTLNMPRFMTYAYMDFTDIEGDVANLPVGLTTLGFNNCPTLYGDVAYLPPGAIYAWFNHAPLIYGDIVNLPATIVQAKFHYCALMTGALADLQPTVDTIIFGYCPLITGAIAHLPPVTDYVNLNGNAWLTGATSDIPATATLVEMENCGGFDGDSIDQLTGLVSMDVDNNGFNQAEVDSIIDSMYQAVLLDANHFTASNPKLYIGGVGNAAPSGVYQFAAIPATGLEKVYYLCHLVAHHWSISWNGGSGP